MQEKTTMNGYPEPVTAVEIAEAALDAVVTDPRHSAPVSDQRPSILFCCPGAVLDMTSGAALSLRTILSALVARGFRAVALQATIFDSEQGGKHVHEAGKQQPNKPIWRTHVGGVEHLIVRTGHFQRRYMNCQEEETYMNLFRAELRFRRPDAVFLWGGLILERTVMREARDAGIPVVFYLVNPGYKDKSVFNDVSLIITDTQATADLYRERHGFDCKVVGKFIDPEDVQPKVPHRPDCITFINPSFEKGVSIFMPLARLAAREAPELRFLVVESRGKWVNALAVLGFKAGDFPNVKVIGHQHDMRRVYASTRVVLLPSLWHESGARVIAESQINHIPVLASDTGGSAELIGDGGRVFPLREEVREKRGEVMITDDELRPWIEELRRLWNDDTYYASVQARVAAQADRFDINHSVDRFIHAIAPHTSEDRAGVWRALLTRP
jgi:glycosyltransferase involved in cell wall biosynthesis